MSYDFHSETRPGNAEKITTTLQSLWQKHAIMLVALIESATRIALTVLQGMGITSRKHQSKMINLIKFEEKKAPLGPTTGSTTNNFSWSLDLKDIDHNAVFAAGCDGTAINTGVTFGIIQR